MECYLQTILILLAVLRLVAGEAPVISLFNRSSVREMPGTRVELICSFRGSEVVAEWSVNGTGLEEGFHNGIFIRTDWRKTTLLILEAREENSGVYQCRVRNQFGEATEEATVLISAAIGLPVPCPAQFDGFCSNGGTCFHPADATPPINDSDLFCECPREYAPPRCQFKKLDYVRSQDQLSVGSIIAVICAVAILIGAGVFVGYCIRARQAAGTSNTAVVESGMRNGTTLYNGHTEMVTMLSSQEDVAVVTDNNNVKEPLHKQTT